MLSFLLPDNKKIQCWGFLPELHIKAKFSDILNLIRNYWQGRLRRLRKRFKLPCTKPANPTDPSDRVENSVIVKIIKLVGMLYRLISGFRLNRNILEEINLLLHYEITFQVRICHSLNGIPGLGSPQGFCSGRKSFSLVWRFWPPSRTRKWVEVVGEYVALQTKPVLKGNQWFN